VSVLIFGFLARGGSTNSAGLRIRIPCLADLNDPYVKAFRWASDRILQNGEGVVALVTNSNFIEGIAFDGMRKHLVNDFDLIYILDLGGNVRKNPKLSGTTHNVLVYRWASALIF